MGGKGRRRREKNYLAAHGGDKRLPPPPTAKELEALPSKLRKIMEFKNSSGSKHGDTISSAETRQGKRKDESSGKKKPNLNVSRSTASNLILGDHTNDKTENNLVMDKNGSAEVSSADTRKRKRKRNSAKDLRFEALDQLGKHSKRKERKKEYLKERKNKHKKVKANHALDFPGRENIRFGEVVEAPPKLSLPKMSKTLTVDASKERLRQQAVELYRKRRGWESRPGLKLPL
ncbi:uncharacterized protein LOC110114765 [Dendrobium catenatum]|uniref:Coiled-coil domain-containing protein 137 n=1 Tax=Dendrobium catenatum TaxID=906689 RepID=A0A2I0X161_9ASPA|nr:uncharacterized protein LOC110114765 [Dendrobium catenatum]PKU81641.1 hypothetical protein MA16_Dca013072 [Dendrobium catenatum]